MLNSQKDKTKKDQIQIESVLGDLYNELTEMRKLGSTGHLENGILNKKAHAKYLAGYLKKMKLPASLETHRTWVLYFLLNGLEILNQTDSNVESISDFDKLELIEYVNMYWNPSGRFHSSRGRICEQLWIHASSGHHLPSSLIDRSSAVRGSLSDH